MTGEPDVSHDANPSPEDSLNQAKGKVFIIGLAAAVSVLYCWGCLYAYEFTLKPDGWFVLLCTVGVGVVILTLVPWPGITFIFPRPPSMSKQRKLTYVALYVVTLDYVLLVAIMASYTGGTIRSPYSVILLTIAVLSPFLTDESKTWPMVVVLAFVVATYLLAEVAISVIGAGELYGTRTSFSGSGVKTVSPAYPEAPTWVIAITAVVSVLISIGLELAKRKIARMKN